MRHTQIQAFNSVAREGGFLAAARVMGLTQPAVSIQVRALEDTYGIKLFKRKGNGVALTPAGRELFLLTQEMISVEERINTFLTANENLETGELRLSVDDPHLAMQLIAAFRLKYPGVKVGVELGNARDVWASLIDGHADAVVAANPQKDSRMKITPLYQCALHVLVPAAHAWVDRASVPIRELSRQPVILREPQSNTRRTLNRILGQARVEMDVVLEVGGREAVVEAVAANLGIGFVFEHEVPGDNRVRTVPLKNVKTDNSVVAGALKSNAKRNVVKAFLQTASEWVEQA